MAGASAVPRIKNVVMNRLALVALVGTLLCMAALRRLAPFGKYLSDPNLVATFMVPNDEAFRLYLRVLGLDAAGLLALDDRLLAYLLTYHVVSDAAVTKGSLSARQVVASELPGYNFTVTKSGNDVFIATPGSRSKVVQADLRAGKGIVHVIDRVLVPFDLFNAPYIPLYENMMLALATYDLEMLALALNDTLGKEALIYDDVQGTFFAPTNEAFDQLGQALSAKADPATVRAALEALDADPSFQTALIGDHAFLGQTLLAADLASRGSITVGLQPTLYTQPNAPKLLVRADPRTGALTVSDFTSAHIINPNILVGRAGRLVLHIVDGVLMTAHTAAMLNLTTGAAAPSGADGGGNSTGPSPSPSTSPSTSPAGSNDTVYPGLMEAFGREQDLGPLMTLSAQAGLTTSLVSVSSPITIFAPTPAAFSALFAYLTSISPELIAKATSMAADIIGDHVHIGTRFLAADLTDGLAIPVGLDPRAYASRPGAAVVISVNATGTYVAHDLSQAAAMRASGQTTTLLALYETASKSSVGIFLNQFLAQPYTLFAPTDEAFNAYFAATGTTLAAVSADPFKMGGLLLPHLVLSQAIPFDQLTNGRTLEAGHALLSLVPLTVRRSGDVVVIVAPKNSALITRSAIKAGSAQIHVVDTVLRN
ncbi:hypothetical protein GPECTOR_10g903 [Gonium pectorale]|uniref:FAS1 domain-containing protein n=1 Tax=Gonium pectorale TaxID=33097 RepID=A0A150GR97_GONPE|nr:hypothetical protein GPECTOR_10g903 [Gonium pectorale]|eukprot:KXZ52272.1 hypothetical protein GPECTOR_10g903 [Gonium pectorale]